MKARAARREFVTPRVLRAARAARICDSRPKSCQASANGLTKGGVRGKGAGGERGATGCKSTFFGVWGVGTLKG